MFSIVEFKQFLEEAPQHIFLMFVTEADSVHPLHLQNR